ncbi:MAG: hypothetical protein AVDCRST_MAG13-2643, partial [uncultured Solirubrobacteraceae bacterium]
GLLRRAPRQAEGQGARARPAVRAHDGGHRAGRRARHPDGREGGDRLPAPGHGRLLRDRAGDGGARALHGRGHRHDGEHDGGHLRLPLDGVRRPGHRGPRGRGQLGGRRPGGRGLRRPGAVRGLRLRRAVRPAGLLHLQLQARLLVPVRPRGRPAAALDRGGAAAAREARDRAADRAGARALVPALGHTDL